MHDTEKAARAYARERFRGCRDTTEARKKPLLWMLLGLAVGVLLLCPGPLPAIGCSVVVVVGNDDATVLLQTGDGNTAACRDDSDMQASAPALFQVR